jgi:hypothetical protein
MLMYKKKSCPYITASPHPWLLRDGVCMLGWSPWRFSGEGFLLKIVITLSSPGKGTTSPSTGASSIFMPQDRDPVVMKLFIRLQSRSLCLMA